MEKLTIILLHIGTLLIGMLCFVFVEADYVSRYVFLGFIGANVSLTLSNIYNLSVGALFKTIGVLLIANIATKMYTKYNLSQFSNKYITKLKMMLSKRQSTPRVNNTTHIRPTSVTRREDLNLSNGQSNGQASVDRRRYHMMSHDHGTYSLPTRRETVTREGSAASSVSSRRSVHDFQQCTAMTIKGTQCLNALAYNSTEFCNLHSRLSRDRER